MVEDRVDHFLVAVDGLENPLGHPGFEEEFGQAHGERGVALARLHNEGVADDGRDRAHPQRDHRGEVERRDARADPDRLAHRIDVDAGAGTDGIFALQHMRRGAGEFDDVEPALDVAARVGDHLAMLGGQHLRELIHIGFDEALEFEHHARAALRVRSEGHTSELQSLMRTSYAVFCLKKQTYSTPQTLYLILLPDYGVQFQLSTTRDHFDRAMEKQSAYHH